MGSGKERNMYMLKDEMAAHGYDMWRHRFLGKNVRTGELVPFFVDYYVVNPARGGFHPVFGSKGTRRPSYMMIKAGRFGTEPSQINRFFGSRTLDIASDALRIVAEDCIISEDVIRGYAEYSPADAANHPERMSDVGKISWQLRVKRTLPYEINYSSPKYVYKVNAFGMYRHVSGRKTLFSGSVFMDNEEYEVTPRECAGYSDKIWGSEFTAPTFLITSNNLKSKTSGEKLTQSSFLFWGGETRMFGISLGDKINGTFMYEGTEIEFKVPEFWKRSSEAYRIAEKNDGHIFRVHSSNIKGYTIDISLKCRLSELLSMNYEAPEGTKNYDRLLECGSAFGYVKLYKKVNKQLRLVDYIEVRNAFCETGENNKYLPVKVD